MGFVFQLVYTGCLVLCYLVYFVRFVGSEEANRKGFPIKTVGELLPRSAPGEVWLTAIIIHIQQGTKSIIIHIHQGTTSIIIQNPFTRVQCLHMIIRVILLLKKA